MVRRKEERVSREEAGAEWLEMIEGLIGDHALDVEEEDCDRGMLERASVALEKWRRQVLEVGAKIEGRVWREMVEGLVAAQPDENHTVGWARDALLKVLEARVEEKEVVKIHRARLREEAILASAEGASREWREALEEALGLEPDPANHTSTWARGVVREIREIGNRPRTSRRHLPDERAAITKRMKIGAAFKLFVTVGTYADGTPGEIFLCADKEGSTISGLLDVIATLTSLALQYGVPLEALVEKFTHMRFEPDGMTGDPEIPIAKSPVDYVFRWLGQKFLPPPQPVALTELLKADQALVKGAP